ncbi:YolA family protein [Dickeya zeae]|uniref:YolA family protein n=1 Tax=Dickeya zeae TaxID=204042 RepID=UPI000B126435|nr:YolA family protein [Dickeya zeae]
MKIDFLVGVAIFISFISVFIFIYYVTVEGYFCFLLESFCCVGLICFSQQWAAYLMEPLRMRMSIKIGFTLGMVMAAISPVYAQTSDEPVQTVITALDSPFVDHPLSAGSEQDVSSSGHKALRAPAPALSSVQVYAVYSSLKGGWQAVPTNVVSLSGYAGGTLRIAVLEKGYGGNRIGWLNGGQTSPYQVNAVCVVNGSYTESCPAGSIVSGWMAYFNADNMSSVVFRYQSTSTNFPNRTLSTSINIQ